MDLTVTEEDDSWRCVFVLLCLLGSSLPDQWLLIAPTAIAQTCTPKNLGNVCIARWLRPIVHYVFISTTFFHVSDAQMPVSAIAVRQGLV